MVEPAKPRDPLTGFRECRHGRLLYLKRDRYIGKAIEHYGEFSELEAAVFGAFLRPGDVAVDGGANIGAHTVHMANLVGPTGKVLAFEPQRVIFTLLCGNIAFNEAFQVVPVQAALGAAPGVLRVPALDYGAAGNFGGVSLLETAGQGGEEVPVRTLDSFKLDKLALLKVDVEGMEFEALSGAADTIKRLRPILYVENDREMRSPRLIRLIGQMGYNMWWHLPPLFNPGNFDRRTDDIYPGVVSINLLCVPRERSIEIVGARPVSGPDDWWQRPAG